MVHNPKLIPKMDALFHGAIGRRRQEIRKIIGGCWRSCIEAGEGLSLLCDAPLTAPPFVADAIIANPPSFAHIHCAEKLGIPLHLMFTLVCPSPCCLYQRLTECIECPGPQRKRFHIRWRTSIASQPSPLWPRWLRMLSQRWLFGKDWATYRMNSVGLNWASSRWTQCEPQAWFTVCAFLLLICGWLQSVADMENWLIL